MTAADGIAVNTTMAYYTDNPYDYPWATGCALTYPDTEDTVLVRYSATGSSYPRSAVGVIPATNGHTAGARTAAVACDIG